MHVLKFAILVCVRVSYVILYNPWHIQHNSQLGGESIWFEIVWRGWIAAGESFYFCLLLFEDKVKSSG